MFQSLLLLLVLLLSVITLLAGMFAAGYMRLYEVLVEYVLIVWTVAKIVLDVVKGDEDRTRRKSLFRISWKWFRTFKTRKVSQILDGKIVLPLLQVILLGLSVGWVSALVFLFSRDWQQVISREIKETLFDILISVSLITFVYMLLKGAYPDAQDDDYDDALDFRDPDTDPLKSVWEVQGRMIRSGLSTVRYMLTSHTILFLGIIAFGMGWLLDEKIHIAFLDALRQWEISPAPLSP